MKAGGLPFEASSTFASLDKNVSEQLVICPSCGTKNRLPSIQSGRTVVCGKCKTPLADSTGTSPMAITDGTFADQVERGPMVVLLDCWADWCGPCHMLAPTIDQLAVELAGRVKVAKLNIDQNPSTANRFGVRSIPTLLVLKGGREIDRLVGVQPKQEILRRLQPFLV
jgi:thioredoxin 2